MKRRIYTVTILISFVLAMSHEMIPHHHHEFLANDFSIHTNEQHNHAHHNQKHHHPHEGDDENKGNQNTRGSHDHSFPVHQHVFNTEDIQFIRLNGHESGQTTININEITYASVLLSNSLLKPPAKNPDQYPYWKSGRLKYFYFTSSNPLRAPPYLV